ncbi:RNA-binding domain-containing protein [Phytopseudomonas seleniipraecipitans]|uniref:ATP-dependent DNA helicase RecG n=1 Tax=Phytopseudomonas seleniipraecipitans TaxID=640205 RepID=A0A1G7JAD0_9GAMM|nr:RNA-binding domain-containing protein [Pseudomonas seleniipraecipitans]SDF21833.1 ATP-dependent DNA helicase RecG [Pseudomonas seleniipraecipitans]
MFMKSEEELLEIIRACEHVDSELLESEEVEFKEYSSVASLHGAKDLAEEVSALANKKGGIVIVGIRDGGNVLNKQWASQLVGFERGDIVEIEQRIKGKLKPNIDLRAHYIQHAGKNYLAIHIPPRRDTLVSTSSGKTCIRDGRSSRPMAPEEIRMAVSGLVNYDWTAEVMEHIHETALDPKSVAAALEDFCIRKKYSNDERPTKAAFLEAIGATTNGVVTKSGLLFLGQQNDILKWLGTYEYRFTWRKASGELLENTVWDDNLWNSIQRIQQLFSACNSEVPLVYKGKTHPCKLLDSTAFHECFMNALVHRDYSIEGMVVVDYNFDRMMVTNPGVFYGGVTAENISTHQPRHRNKALAKLLMNFQLVDRAGMGVKRMNFGSLAYGREFPSFKESFDTVEVSLPAKAIIPEIFVQVQNAPDSYSVCDLIILNSLYRIGHVDVTELAKRISTHDDNTWKAINTSVENHSELELCGTNAGVFVRFKPNWATYFKVQNPLKISTTSSKHVKLFGHLQEFGEASNENITLLLGHKNTTHTSAFLRKSSYAVRTGNGPSAKWSLVKRI